MSAAEQVRAALRVIAAHKSGTCPRCTSSGCSALAMAEALVNGRSGGR